MPARSLALLEDRVERALGRRRVGHGDELGPPEIGARRLCAWRPDEQVALAELVSEVHQTLLDRAVQVADGCEVLQLGHDVAFGHQRHRLVHGRVDAFRTFERHALRALEKNEVL
jgi:hypothetical protein